MKRIIFICSLAFIFAGCGTKLTPDQKAIKKVLSDYTTSLQKGDITSAYNKIAQVSKNQIPLQEFTNTWTKNLTQFKIKNFSIENITILEINSKRYATAIVKRTDAYFTNNKKHEQRIDYHLFEDDGKWGILRTNEIDEKIKTYLANGDTLKAYQLAKICIEIDPFVASTIDQYIAKLMEISQSNVIQIGGQTLPKISQKDVTFKIIDKGYKDYSFFIKYEFTNKAYYPITSLDVKVIWKKPNGDILDEIVDGFAVVFNNPLDPGDSKTREITFSPSEKEVTHLLADFYVSINDSKWNKVFENIDISIPSVLNDVNFEIISTSFERSMAATLAEYIYTGRIDYRITNISTKPIDRLVVKVVWFKSGTQEVLDDEEDYLITSSDIPLQPGFSKTDYITCSKGLRYSNLDLIADIYISRFYGKYELVRKGVVIK